MQKNENKRVCYIISRSKCGIRSTPPTSPHPFRKQNNTEGVSISCGQVKYFSISVCLNPQIFQGYPVLDGGYHDVRICEGTWVFNHGQPFPSVSHNQCASPPSPWFCSRCQWDACGAEWCVQGSSCHCPVDGVRPPCSAETTRTLKRNRMGINKDWHMFINNEHLIVDQKSVVVST